MSFYQKYRPEKIEELDSSLARQVFERVMKSGELAHAYLLIGPRGIGKTSTARIIARLINCEENYTNGKLNKNLVEPCGECQACVSISNGSAVDVIEMDAASHRGIEDIRDLREKIHLAPAYLKKKVYIIDEVHMLTNEAFNALLKTLEEPPAHAMFILCTTEAHKVPETIMSRCVKVGYQKANKEEVARSLMRAVKGEKINITPEAIELLAGSVDGSFREGHKLLEQLADLKEEITAEMVRSVLRLGRAGIVEGILMAVDGGEAKEVIAICRELEEQGAEVTTLVAAVLEKLKEEMRDHIENGEVVPVGRRLLMKKLIKVIPKVRISPLPLLPLEMILVEAALRRKDSGGKSEVKVIKESVGTKTEAVDKIRTAPMALPEENVDRVINDSSNVSPVEFSRIMDEWPNFLEGMREVNGSLMGLLRTVHPKEIKDHFLTLEVAYKFHKEQLEHEQRRRIVENEMAKRWGPMSIRCVLADKTEQTIAKMPDADNISAKVEDGEVLKAAEEIFGS